MPYCPQFLPNMSLTIILQLPPSGQSSRLAHSDRTFADFEAGLVSKKKRRRSFSDSDESSSDSESSSPRHKHKHSKHKDKRHKHKDKHKEKHKDKHKKSKRKEISSGSEDEHLPPAPREEEVVEPKPNKPEPVRVIPHDPALDLISTDWMTSAPPPSSWRKKAAAEPENPAPSEPKKPNLELNPQLNAESTLAGADKFTVGDGGAGWARATGISTQDRSSQRVQESRAQSSGGARWKREEARAKPDETKPLPSVPAPAPVLVQRSVIEEDLTGVDLNQLKSQIMKAKLHKKTDLVAELEAKMERARRAQSGDTNVQNTIPSHMKLVDDLDAHGRSRSATTDKMVSTHAEGHKANPRALSLRDESGERSKYFADDDDADLDTLVARERLERRLASASGDSGGISSMDKHFAENVMRKKNYKGDALYDGLYDYDDDVDYMQYESREKKLSGEQLAQREKQRAVQQTQRYDKATENCYYCLRTKKIPAHLIVSMGYHTSLVVPERGFLIPGHCIIVSHEHFASSTTMEDSTWKEVLEFMKALTQFFESQGKTPLFLETATDFHARRHTFIDCIPLDKRDAGTAPLYFRKALAEAGGDSATHRDRYDFKLPGKTIRQTIPAHFAYFMVQFGMDSGFAHHIEEKSNFSSNFGREVVGGILQLPEETYMGRAKPRPLDKEKRQVAEFKEAWTPFDWTRSLYQ